VKLLGTAAHRLRSQLVDLDQARVERVLDQVLSRVHHAYSATAAAAGAAVGGPGDGMSVEQFALFARELRIVRTLSEAEVVRVYALAVHMQLPGRDLDIDASAPPTSASSPTGDARPLDGSGDGAASASLSVAVADAIADNGGSMDALSQALFPPESTASALPRTGAAAVEQTEELLNAKEPASAASAVALPPSMLLAARSPLKLNRFRVAVRLLLRAAFAAGQRSAGVYDEGAYTEQLALETALTPEGVALRAACWRLSVMFLLYQPVARMGAPWLRSQYHVRVPRLPLLEAEGGAAPSSSTTAATTVATRAPMLAAQPALAGRVAVQPLLLAPPLHFTAAAVLPEEPSAALRAAMAMDAMEAELSMRQASERLGGGAAASAEPASVDGAAVPSALVPAYDGPSQLLEHTLASRAKAHPAATGSQGVLHEAAASSHTLGGGAGRPEPTPPPAMGRGEGRRPLPSSKSFSVSHATRRGGASAAAAGPGSASPSLARDVALAGMPAMRSRMQSRLDALAKAIGRNAEKLTGQPLLLPSIDHAAVLGSGNPFAAGASRASARPSTSEPVRPSDTRVAQPMASSVLSASTVPPAKLPLAPVDASARPSRSPRGVAVDPMARLVHLERSLAPSEAESHPRTSTTLQRAQTLPYAPHESLSATWPARGVSSVAPSLPARFDLSATTSAFPSDLAPVRISSDTAPGPAMPSSPAPPAVGAGPRMRLWAGSGARKLMHRATGKPGVGARESTS